jgi:hypothetical protein
VKQTPRGLYGPARTGLGDPTRVTPQEALRYTLDDVLQRRREQESFSPLVRLLRRTSDRALGRS